MAPRRSSSPSTPSEGEIIESGSDTKATTPRTYLNELNVDRNSRTDVSPAPPASVPGSASLHLSHRPSRSRSPYRESRGEKRRLGVDYDVDRKPSSRHIDQTRRDERYRYERGAGPSSRRHHHRSYYDHDRNDGYDRRLHYHDDTRDRRVDKRRRTSRSRSPFRESGAPKRYVNDVDSGRLKTWENHRSALDGRNRRASTEQSQSVSGRDTPPVNNTYTPRYEAELRETQVQQADYSANLASESKTVANNGATREAEAPSAPLDEVSLIEQRRKRREAIKAKYRDQGTPLLIKALQTGNGTEPAAREHDSNSGDQGSRQGSPFITTADTSGAQSPPTDLDVAKDEDLASRDVESRGGLSKEEPSAADYDPTNDMREDKMRHDRRHFGEEVSASAYDETKPTKQDVLIPQEPDEAGQPKQMKAKDPFDMFAEDVDDDDMFADETQLRTQVASAAQAAGPDKAILTVQQPQELDMSMMDNWDDPEGYYNVMLGELINGRYHVQQNLGKGMFSSVVRAMDSKTGSLVAVKIIRNNDTMRKAGIKEIEILQELRMADPDDKKHIVRFDRQFDHKGHLCMVFENLSMNLREVLKKFGRDVGINLRAIRAYAQQMFLGLNLLRKCSMLHADVKPDNLLVNDNRNILKICDLGSASPASESEITPYLVSRFYRAPEIILGVPYDYAIDVWSVGCTLYELYTGKILFTGRTNNQMLRSIMECRGKFPPKFLRRGTLTHLHFDDMLNFRSVEEDKVTGRMVTKVLDFKKPTRDLKSRLMGKGSGSGSKLTDKETKEISLFIDLLDRCLNTNPEKRCTPSEALKHPFIMRSKA